jgi:hypothetical protein
MTTRTVLDAAERNRISQRIRSLPSDAARRWGTMNVSEMFRHAADGIDEALGRRPDEDLSNPFTRTVVKWLVVRRMPMLCNVPTSRRMDPRREGSPTAGLEADRARLLGVLEEFAAGSGQTRHPFFGPLSREEWGMLTLKHLDHHLRQFGG